MLEALVLAVGLAMDATAVAAARSITGMSRRELLVLASAFGLFQAAMATAGWLLGDLAAEHVAAWDHWIAFGLLLGIGGKMVLDALRGGDGDVPAGPLGVRTVVVLSIATSIDALAAGVTLPTIAAPPAVALALIGVISFALSALGGLIGGRLGARLGTGLEVVGGLALIAIGAKILVEHLVQ